MNSSAKNNMKVLITGSSGVGKTTVIEELAKRGYMAIDGDDEPGLAQLVIASTGKPADWPEGYIDWSYYHWDLQLPVLKEVLKRGDTVFLGGVYSNQPDYYYLFDKIIALTITPEEHLQRLRARPPREAGDHEQNIQDRLHKYSIMLKRFLDGGAVTVDASLDIDATVDAILKLVNDAD